ncbi:MAG: sulfurtransferase-like selenium metabolism protein YedF [Desulfuromonas sp.]|nr:MAG: sulfurtransferase-like selenium metabolism protein YedF [Desulfuromonas sp.]
MKTLDMRKHQCPYPVVQTRKAMLDDPESPLTVLVGDETARENVSRLAESMGYSIDTEENDDTYTLSLAPGEVKKEEAASQTISGKTVTLITSELMGRGDDELGHILMKNYLVTLTEMADAPDKMLLVNSGVKLACTGSDAIEALEKLACMGVDIASCGLCLEFYELKDSLLVGRTTNMLEVAESLQTAGRLIRM